MINKQFIYEDVTYNLSFENGRSDKHSITFFNSNLGLTQSFKFKKLIIDTEIEQIITWYDIQLFAANGDRVVHPDITKNEVKYITTQSRYLQWIGLMGPILMPMLSDNICENEELPKQYIDEVVEITNGLIQLSQSLNV